MKRYLLIACLLPSLGLAADEADNKSAWSGRGSLGLTTTSGNTDSDNLNTSLQLSRESQDWKHSFSVDSLQGRVDDEVVADNLVLRARSELNFEGPSYGYGQARYEENPFGGFEHQASLVAGAGSRFIENESHLLDLSLGLGYRDTKDSEFSVTTNSGILASDLRYEYKFSATSTFIQTGFLEAGEDNTHIESETALLSKISSAFSSKISYLVKHNSDVTPDIKKTDTILNVALVYDF